MGSLWRDALEVAAARLAEWDDNKAAAATKLNGTPCPFTSAEFPLAVLDAAARIPVG
jgi:hypothetical protein